MHSADSMSDASASDEPRPLERTVARAAAVWLVRLHEEATAQDIAACDRWRAADPAHEQAWQRAQWVNAKFGGVPPTLGMSTLGRKRRVDRRTALKAMTVLWVAGTSAYVVHRSTPWRQWMSDERTAVGERRSIVLADGTRLDLDTATAVDIAFSDTERRLILNAGTILVRTGPDRRALTTSYRPFIVETREGRIRALGTRFVVNQEPGGDSATSVAVLQSRVEITPDAAPQSKRIIEAGQQTYFTATGIAPTTRADPHVADWSSGVLYADRMRLDDFAAELGRYRAGILRCDPAVADLRITGAFQLDNTDSILAALPETLPVQLVYRTRYWVTLVAPAGRSSS
jgi:transmembrane sensor